MSIRSAWFLQLESLVTPVLDAVTDVRGAFAGCNVGVCLKCYDCKSDFGNN